MTGTDLTRIIEPYDQNHLPNPVADYSMSPRFNPPITGSDSGKRYRTAETSYPSYSLGTYLRNPPISATERLLANQTSITPADSEKKTRTELETWSSNFDRAAKSGGQYGK
ncbi:hypothetical protein F5Y05DRAFT_102992 [Hypoxylon sp. FL0543]|nr:hypothetical protein F5Y05DRAFT_102992 [Hypoxylon sp. FL0543]